MAGLQLYLTDAGRALLAANDADPSIGAVTLTNAQLGDGAGLGTAADAAGRTTLRNRLVTAAIAGVQSPGGRIAATVEVLVAAAQDYRELGVFASRAGGPETLLLYGASADVIASATANLRLVVGFSIDILNASDDVAVELSPTVSLADVRDATETAKGVVELATADEAKTGTDAVRAVTPAGLAAALQSSEQAATFARRGTIELATDAEARTGNDTDRAVTPASLEAALESADQAATTGRRGTVELATDAEAKTGTDAVRVVTPAGLDAALRSADQAASDSRRGVVELATDEEARTGTDALRAVTPAALRAVLSLITVLHFAAAQNLVWDRPFSRALVVLKGGDGGWNATQQNNRGGGVLQGNAGAASSITVGGNTHEAAGGGIGRSYGNPLSHSRPYKGEVLVVILEELTPQTALAVAVGAGGAGIPASGTPNQLGYTSGSDGGDDGWVRIVPLPADA